MKKMILATVLVSMLPASAFAEKILVQVAAVDAVISSVELTDRAELKIQRRDGRLLAEKLSSANTQLLIYAQQLATAQLKTEHRAVTCKMMPLYVTSLKVAAPSGDLRVVLSPRGCQIADLIYPQNESLDDMATKLEDQLVLLAKQFGEE